MNFKYTLTEPEMIAAMKLHGLGRKSTRIGLGSVGFLLVLVAVFSEFKLFPIAMVCGGIAGYLITYFLIIPWQARKHYRELKSIQSEINLQIHDGGIKIQSSTGNSDMDWSYFKKWKHDKNIILLYITSRSFICCQNE